MSSRKDERHTRMVPAAAEGAAGAAARVLAAGGLVAFPTETVYGLGADATQGRAVAGIYAAKGRPSFNPLISHVASLDMAQREGLFSPLALRLARAFWPGPLTLVVPRAPGGTVSDLACAGLGSVGLRMPAHPVARALIAALGRPVAGPSANLSGHVSPTSAAHVAADLDGRIDMILDAGPCAVGVESTILMVAGDKAVLLRPGGLDRAALEEVVGTALESPPKGEAGPIAPGMLASHYAPRAAVRLEATSLRPGEAALDFAGQLPGASPRIDLSPTGDLREAAAALFAALRSLDASGARAIAVAPVPAGGLGEAINDRLRRAAAPR